MSNGECERRDLARMFVPQVGRVVNTADPVELYGVVDAAGDVVAPIAVYLRQLQAAGRSPATLRSYALDLLRWFGHRWRRSPNGSLGSFPELSAGEIDWVIHA